MTGANRAKAAPTDEAPEYSLDAITQIVNIDTSTEPTVEDDILIVESGDIHMLESSSTETYARAEVDGTLSVEGVLCLEELDEDADALIVSSGDVYTIAPGDTQVYEFVTVDGTMDVQGTLTVTG